MMMRINFKTILLILIVAVLSSILTSWNNCGNNFFLRNVDWKAQLQHKVSLTPEVLSAKIVKSKNPNLFRLFALFFNYKQKFRIGSAMN